MGAEAKGAPFPPNTMLDDKYRLDQLLEVGGMGAVYVGTHTRLQKQVAIKVLRRELAEMPDMIERFQREAVAASRIGHENIVDVSDLGTASDGSPFLVMEYLNGETLGARIRNGGAMSIGLACAIAREILAAIGAAHAVGIIHRDLKPENVFLALGARGESIKILDFGISRVSEGRTGEGGDLRLTATGQVMGTPYYMAPEQAAGRSDLSGVVDVYAVGVILYEMLSGTVPFVGGNYNTVIYKVLAGQYEPLSSVLGSVPQALESIVTRAMALEPEHRYPSAAALAAALEPFTLDDEHSSLVAPVTPLPRQRVPHLEYAATVAPDSVDGAAPAAHFQPQARAPSRTRRWVPVVIGLLLVTAGSATAILLAKDDTKEEAAAPAPVAEPAPAPAAVPPPVVEAPPPVALPPAEQPVVIAFEVQPADAAIQVDGKPLAGTELSVPREQREVEVAVSRDGFKPKTRRISLSSSRTVEVILEKVPAPRVKTKRRDPEPEPKGPTKKDRIIDDSPYD
ncbi:MAG TPA: serine/threonine-protein kinase [Kofleriaceae bacterium]|nr:serine/threonine-protein kinase [Kofleriaceae bacterium]